MKLNLYSVFDSKMASFGHPYATQRDEAAIRSFSDAVNNPAKENDWYRHPEDYSLYRIGEFDNDSAKLTPCLPEPLITASAARATRERTPIEDFKENALVS